MFLRELAETDHPGELLARAETDPTLEASLAAACASGNAAFGNLALDDRTYAKHLARTIKMAGAAPRAISTLAIEDLFLACACLVGVEGAAAAFSARHGATIRGTIARIVRGADNKEVAVFVSPETRFRLTPQGGTFTDLRPGTNVTVFFNTTNQRNMAQHVFVPHTAPRR